MKNSVLYILFFVVGTMSLSAQILSQDGSLSLDHDTVVEHGFYDTSYVEAHTFLRNLTNQDLTVRWQKIEYLPTGWASSFCDNTTCWPAEITTNVLDLPANGGSSIFDIRFYPDYKPGAGDVYVVAYVEGRDSAASAVGALFNGVAEKSVGLFDNMLAKNNDNIKIYPNPVRNMVLIRNLPEYQRTTVEVYNIFGKRMLSFSNAPSSSSSQIQQFDVESLPKGIYMIRIYDSFMNVIYTKSISKVNN